MSIAAIWRTLWRQRLFVIPAAVVAGLMCGFVVVKSPPTYRASGSVVLLAPPPLPQTQIGGPTIPADWQNPYTRIGDLSVVVDVLVRVLGSDSVVADLAAKGFEGRQEVAGNRDYYSGPIIDVAAEAPDGAKAIADVKLLINELGDQLQRMQQGTAADYHIKSAPVIAPDKATTVFSGTMRLLLLAISLGVALVVGVGLTADRVRRGASRSRPRAAARDGRVAPKPQPAQRRPARAVPRAEGGPNRRPAQPSVSPGSRSPRPRSAVTADGPGTSVRAGRAKPRGESASSSRVIDAHERFADDGDDCLLPTADSDA